MKKLICGLLLSVILAVSILPISAASTEEVTGSPAPAPSAPAEGETDGFVWVNRTYELKASDYKSDFSNIFFRMWWQFNNINTEADIAVREIQIWVEGEKLETHTGTSFSKIMVEGESEKLPNVTRSGDGTVSVAKGSACKYTQLQFYTDGYNPLEKGDHTITFRVLVRLENVSDSWDAVLAASDNVFICNFWGDGLRGEYWLTAWDNNTIITKNECTVGSGNNEAFEKPADSEENTTAPTTPDTPETPSLPSDTESDVTAKPPVPTKPVVTEKPSDPTTSAGTESKDASGTQASGTAGGGCASSAAMIPLMLLALCGTVPVFCRKKDH